MPTITAQTLVDRAELIANDTTNVRWAASEWLGWLNDGQREIVTLRPDAYPKTAAMQLTAGTKQSIPSDGHTLLKITRNMGSDGATPGAAIRGVSASLMDSSTPSWHTTTGSATTLHYIFDPRTPKVFYIYPKPTDTAHYVEVVYSVSPPDVPALANVITLDDIYANPLLDYMLFRGYSKDFESASSAARAVAQRQAFENTLGLKAQADAAGQPVQTAKG